MKKEEGIFINMPNEEYHAIKGVSSTNLKMINKSCKLFNNKEHFVCEKACFNQGSLLHTAILEPTKVVLEYIEASTYGIDTVSAKTLSHNHPNKTVVGKGMVEEAIHISKLVHLIYGDYIKGAKKEISFIHKEKESGLIYKARPDIWLENARTVIDVKSTKYDNPSDFEKSIEWLGYHVSASWYIDVLTLCGYPTTTFGWICVPKTAPYEPFAFYASDEMIEKGRAIYQEILHKLIKNRENGEDELFKVAHTREFKNLVGGE